MHPQAIKELAQAVIQMEAQAVFSLAERINDDFIQACLYLLNCKSRVIVMGMGKSGLIGAKIASTLASTGTPAFFVHPGEASHGDLGMITAQDTVIVLSNSGETEELLTLIPIIKRLHVPLISMTGNKHSTLALEANVHLDVSVEKEACPLGMAPTSSTTAALVMGDALAISLLEAKGFTEKDFARSHPGGQLGRKLLLHVNDIMHKGNNIPKVQIRTPVKNALIEMSQKGLGMTTVLDSEQAICGVFTYGDLRRTLDKQIDFHTTCIEKVMTTPFLTISQHALAAEALSMMDQYKINSLPVVDDNNALVGAINMHDLLRAKVV